MNARQSNGISARAMYVMVIAALVFPMTGIVHAQDEAPSSLWRDEFDGPLAEPWYWVNENPDKWMFNDGFLRILTSSLGTGEENLLLRPVAEGDFTIKTRVLFEPDTDFQFAGLVIWQDEENYLQFGRLFCDLEGACVGNGIYFDKILGGDLVDGNFATPIDNPSDVFLRLERRGDMVRAFYSLDGAISWYEIGIHWIPSDFQVNGIGLTSSLDFNTPDWDISADFDFFELTEGWGFLPEGFHDFDEGDVPNWACNAGGWAADPDNREADVNIEVVVDHQTVANLVAGDFRQDLLDAGVCVDGNCSFSTSLWGVISSYEPHRVDVWAQDDTGEWVLLSNSAKTLTCRTYDIYAYDPLTGETRQITGTGTDLRETGEYDPTWSQNGKKVAHDVVSDDSHGIYITDVKTGVSTPLIGAQDGGNDAAWSPNGKLIAFDRRWFDDPNIYIVPASGGAESLAREDAVNASWAPNGKRLVFHQPSDGSIRTAAVDGGKGIDTLIVVNGSEPAWSPDGDWIAYEFDGNIWKQRVNIQGTTFGGPIQITHLNAWHVGGPAWSADSQTIIFNAGVSDDIDLWSVPAAGGEITWLTGATGYGEFGPDNARNSSNIAYASFSPEGQAPRTWVAAYTYDAGTWESGTHTYQFWTDGAPNGEEFSFEVSADNPLYPGLALIRPETLRTDTSEGCANIDSIHPDQQTRFHIGWTFDGVFGDAQVYYENFLAQVRWDASEPATMQRHEIFPLTSPVDWFGYTCTFTRP